MKSIPSKKRGRPLTLGDIDKEVQAYIKALRKAGTPVSIQVVLAAAEGVVTARDRTLLQSNGGTIQLKRSWAMSLLGRMKRRGSTSAKSKLSDQAIKNLKHSYLAQIKGVAEVHKIPPELIINWDQTGNHLAPTSNWTMEECGAERVEIAALGDKRQITTTLACTLAGDLLPIQVIYTGKTERCHPTFPYPSGFDVWHSPNHWANEETTLRFIEKIIIPFINNVRSKLGTPEQKALVIFDVFRGQIGERVQALLEDNYIIRVLVPGNCTDLLQPLDLSANEAPKSKMSSCFSEWYSKAVSKQMADPPDAVHIDMRMSVLKEHSCKWLVSAYDYIRSHPDIIVNGFRKAGIIDALENELPAPDNLAIEDDRDDYDLFASCDE